MKYQVRCKTTLSFILALLFSSLFASTLVALSTAETPEAEMWIVDDDGSEADCSSIQAAVNAAKAGDTIYVRSGHYYEHVLINKQVKLLGENPSSTLIDGNFTGDVVTVVADNVEISGFTIQGSGKRIVIDGVPSPSGLDYESICGVYAIGCTGSNFSGNIVRNNFVGIHFESCSNILISRNQIIENYGDCGLRIAFSSSVTLSNNRITLNENSGANIFQCSASTVSENQIVDNLGQGGMVISFKSRFITVTKNNISGNAFHGLNLVNAYENTIFGNNMSSNYFGICLSGSSSNKVYENYMQANFYGVAFFNSPNEQVYNNALVNNTNDMYTSTPPPTDPNSEPYFPPPEEPTTPTPAPDSKVKIRILSPTSEELYQIGLYEAVKKIPLRFTVNEPVSWMGYSLDGQANVTLTGNTTLTMQFTGSHTIVIYAKDSEGNTYLSNMVKFKVASTPSVSINSPKNATTYTTSDIPVSITAVAPSTGVEFIEYRVEGTNCSGVINGTKLFEYKAEGTAVLSGLPNGNYTLIAVAHAWLTGAVGNSTAYFIVDSPQPADSPPQSPSSSPSPVSSLSQSPSSVSSQQFSNANPILSMSLSTKASAYRNFLMAVVAVVSASLLVAFKKRKK